MNRSHFDSSHRLPKEKGQGLAEYAILIAIIGVLTIFGLVLVGGSVQGGFIKVCAALGNEGCQAIETETVVSGTATPTLQVSMTPSMIPTATATLSEPEPTRPPSIPRLTPEPTPARELITMRIKVVINEKGSGKKSAEGIRVVIYNAAGEYVAEGVTDEKGNLSLTVASGSYSIATFYNNVWKKEGPINVTNSRENVIHR
ncbi:MAG: hypothetical protein AABZ00_12545 [Chloroflexota bacterium]